MKAILTVVVVLLVLAGAFYVAAPYLKPSETQTPEAQTETNVVVTNAYVREESDTHMVDIAYPQFGIAVIDAQIQQVINDAVAEFQALPPNPPESATPKHSFEGTFDAAYVGPDVLSVKLILSQYTGGAHPLTLISGLNFDRATGRQLLQSDAFAMIGLTVEQVSAAATAELKAELGDAMFMEGADTNPENFSSFVISENDITFIFQQYQVAAYAAGVQEVSFPRTQ